MSKLLLLRGSSLLCATLLLAAHTVPIAQAGKVGQWHWSWNGHVNGETYGGSAEGDITWDDVVAAARVVGRVVTFPFRAAWATASWFSQLKSTHMQYVFGEMEANGRWRFQADGSWTCTVPGTPYGSGDPFAGQDLRGTPFQSVTSLGYPHEDFRVVFKPKSTGVHFRDPVDSVTEISGRGSVGGAPTLNPKSPPSGAGGPSTVPPSIDAGSVNSAPARVTAGSSSDDSTKNTEPVGGGGVVPTWVYVVVTVSGLVMLILAALFIVLVCRRPRASPSEDIENSAHSYDDF